MTRRKYETKTLPLNEVPKGARWQIETGNHLFNFWKRTAPKKRRSPTTAQLVASIRKSAWRHAGRVS